MNKAAKQVVIVSAVVVATFIALALAGVAQIVSLHGSCERAELRFDSTPAVVCGTNELPIAPSVVIVLFAVLGAAAGLFVVTKTARRS